jgi:hypothetical protein
MDYTIADIYHHAPKVILSDAECHMLSYEECHMLSYDVYIIPKPIHAPKVILSDAECHVYSNSNEK